MSGQGAIGSCGRAGGRAGRAPRRGHERAQTRRCFGRGRNTSTRLDEDGTQQKSLRPFRVHDIEGESNTRGTSRVKRKYRKILRMMLLLVSRSPLLCKEAFATNPRTHNPYKQHPNPAEPPSFRRVSEHIKYTKISTRLTHYVRHSRHPPPPLQHTKHTFPLSAAGLAICRMESTDTVRKKLAM